MLVPDGLSRKHGSFLTGLTSVANNSHTETYSAHSPNRRVLAFFGVLQVILLPVAGRRHPPPLVCATAHLLAYYYTPLARQLFPPLQSGHVCSGAGGSLGRDGYPLEQVRPG